MKRTNYLLTLGLSSTLLAALVGCENDRVAVEDVEDARLTAQQEAAELEAAEDEAAQRIEAKRIALEETLHEEEERLAEAREDAREAQAEAAELTQKFNTQEARAQFLEDRRLALDEAQRQIARLDDDGNELEGVALESHNARIDRLNDLHAEAETTLNELEDAEVAVWDVRRERVDAAIEQLNAEILDSVRGNNLDDDDTFPGVRVEID